MAWCWSTPAAGRTGRLGRGGPIIFKLLRYRSARAILRRIDVKPLVGQGLRSAFIDPKLVTPTLIDRYADFARAPGHRDVLLAGQDRPRGAAVAADLPKIKVPTLIMHGEQDRLIPFADGQAFARVIPGAVLIAYPGVGHVPMEQIPARSANDLDKWLRAKVLSGQRPPARSTPRPIASTE